jgi:DNA polymerase-3 subunit delta
MRSEQLERMSELPCVMVLGDATLRVKEMEEALVDAAFHGASPGFNLSTWHAAEGAEGALEDARTVPMMGRRRVVLIRGFEKAPVALLDALMAYVENPNPSTLLLITGPKGPPAAGGKDRGKRLENQVAKIGHVARHKAKEQNATAYAIERAAIGGCELDPRTADFLVALVGKDLSHLRNEVDKLTIHVGGTGVVDQGTVERVCSLVAEAEVWDLTDAIITCNPDRGLAVAHRMLEDAGSGDGVSHRLLALITWQVRQLLDLQGAMRTGEGTPPSWRRVPSRKLRAAERLLRERPLHPAHIFEALAEANRDFNRSRAGDRRVFEALVMSLTTR